jgi:RimJ/RimL family protein N-acetyltransferase
MVTRLSLNDGIVYLRPFVYGDADPMYAAVAESLADLQPWLSWAKSDFSSRDARQWVQSAIAQWDAGTYYGFVIVDPETDLFIGSCSLGHINQLYRFCNLGYWVRTSYRGQGIAPRAVRLTARFALRHLGLTRVEVVIGVGNAASQRVAEKAGAHYEGILRNRMVVGEKVFDAAMYSFVPEDFGIEA